MSTSLIWVSQRIWTYLDEKHVSRSHWTGLDEENGTVQKDPKGHAQNLKNLDVVFWKSNTRFQSVSMSTTFGCLGRLQLLEQKLQDWLQIEWRQKDSPNKEMHSVMFPPFEVYVKFVQGTARGQKDPSFQFTDVKNAGDCTPHQSAFTVRKTGVNDTFLVEETPHCLIYNNSAHHWQIVIKEKITVLREKYIGFRCLQLNHRIKNCKHDVSCDMWQGQRNRQIIYMFWKLLCFFI